MMGNATNRIRVMYYLKKAYLVCYIVALISCTNNKTPHHHAAKVKKQTPARNLNEWIFESVNDSMLNFKNGKRFNTKLFDLKYIAQIPNGSNPPYLLFSGRECDECDATIDLHIYSPDGKNFDPDKKKYALPGVERDFENNVLLYKARTFYGKVLPDVEGIIWYQQQLMEDNTFQKSVFIARLHQGEVTDTAIKDKDNLN